MIEGLRLHVDEDQNGRWMPQPSLCTAENLAGLRPVICPFASRLCTNLCAALEKTQISDGGSAWFCRSMPSPGFLAYRAEVEGGS